jgi:hypothetical protein
MPKNLLILKFLYGRDRPRGLLAFKELRRAEPVRYAALGSMGTSS